MTEDQRDLLEAARESLAAAKLLSVTVEQAEGQIAHAEEFVAVAERLIGPLPPSTEAT